MNIVNIDLSLIWGGLAASIVIFAAMFYLNMVSQKKYSNKLAQGLAWLQAFRQLLSLIQQHRGTTNGFLCGDQELKKRIQPLQSSINHKITELEKLGGWIDSSESWRSIEDHWQRLSNNYNNLTSANNFEQHTKLILNLLYLIDDCAEQHYLYEIKDTQQRSIRYLWQKLLVTSENIGQARALGTGVAAAGLCSSVDRIRLSYLHQAIKGVVDKQSVSKSEAVTHLLDFIEKNVMIESPTVSANDYFEVATQALEEVLSSFDVKLQEQKNRIQAIKQ